MEIRFDCDCCEFNKNNIYKALEEMPKDSEIAALSNFFKVLGDPTRVKMMYVMSQGEVCVQNIAQALGMTKSAISHQLRGLKERKIVKCRRDGKNVYYSIDDEHVRQVINIAMAHIMHTNK